MQRDDFFDNYKGLLILLVVVAHFIGPFRGESHFMKFIETSIYSFHMPAFIFIIGYFSKRNDLLKLVKRIAIPYLCFQIIYFVMLNYVWGMESDFRILYPKYTLWFMLSAFFWRMSIDKIGKIKGIIPISFLLGIIVGFDPSIGEFAALGRTIAFMPFFILGNRFDKDRFMTYANKSVVKFSSAIVLILFLVIIFFECEQMNFSVLSMKNSYKNIGEEQYGWIYRAIVYLCSTLLIYVIAVLIPTAKHWYSYLGQRTLSIYLLHGLVYKSIQYLTNIYELADTKVEMGLILLFSVALTFVLSLKPFEYLIRKLSKIPIEKLVISE